MYQRIVVPLDGSDIAERALVEAENLASTMQVPLHLIRVVDVMRPDSGMIAGAPINSSVVTAMVATEVEAAAQYLDVLAKKMISRGLTVTTEVRRGPVAHRLLEAVESDDLIVMASHGRTGISRWFMGSVAEEMMRRATVPVLLVPSANHRRMAAPETRTGTSLVAGR